MTLESLLYLPPWVSQAAWSLVAMLTAMLAGRVIAQTIGRRLSAWASKSSWGWDAIVIEGLQRGLPFWSLLVGVYVAIGFWQLPEQPARVIAGALYVMVWLSVTIFTARAAGRLIGLYGAQVAQTVPVTSLTQYITKAVIVILGGLMILNGLGISITPLLTALGVGGLAVALALQDTLSNLFSGFYLSMSGHLRVGDYVKLDSGDEGYIEDIGWRATKIRMLPNNMVLVPNNKISQAVITNYYLPDRELAVLVPVGVHYDSDLDHVERVTCDVGREVMKTVQGGVPGFEPFIRYHTLGDYSIGFTVILRGKEFVDQYLIKHEFVKRLIARYRKEGITIPYPTRTIVNQGAD
jgi:small-conductance mechanosensitive channel